MDDAFTEAGREEILPGDLLQGIAPASYADLSDRTVDPGLGLYQIISELVTFRLCCHGRFYGASNAGNQDSNKGLFG